MPPYSGDWLLTGEGAEGTSTEVTDLAGENGTGEGVGGAGSLRIISSRISAAGWEKNHRTHAVKSEVKEHRGTKKIMRAVSAFF